MTTTVTEDIWGLAKSDDRVIHNEYNPKYTLSFNFLCCTV